MAARRSVSQLVPRQAQALIRTALGSARVVIVNGPRQAGKTTTLGQLHREVGGSLVSFDDDAILGAARRDPVGFVAAYARPLFVDEVQRGGDAFVRAIKLAADRDPRPGSFVLSGSSRFLTVPMLSESLAGRARIIDLWPLAEAEIEGARGSFIDWILGDPWSGSLRIAAPPRIQYFERVCRGGFPEPARLAPGAARRAWFTSYLRTLVQRDIRDLSRIRRAIDLPRFVRLLAARTASELNVAGLATAAGLTADTAHAYLALLETIYLHHTLPSWSRNLTAKEKRRPKVHFVDTGLAAALLGLDAAALASPTAMMGGNLLETLVVNELVKQQAASTIEVALHHFRDRDGAEIDVVLETPDGRVAAIEIKAGMTVRDDDFRWLRWLASKLGQAFTGGVVLHTGSEVVPFGPKLRAVPVAALWTGAGARGVPRATKARQRCRS